MNMVQIQQLKRNLSALVDAAAAGEMIVTTRHNRPIATLGPPPCEGVHRGAAFGRARLEPVAEAGGSVPITVTLDDDRAENR
jgi:prevent-host-death family protein